MAAFAAAACTSTFAQSHTFTDTLGQSFPAQVIAVKNTEVIVRRADGKVYSVDLATLSAADLKFLADWKSTTSNPQIGTATTDTAIEVKISVEDSKPGNPSQLAAKVTLTNLEDCFDYKGLKGTLILVGQQSTSSTKYKVLALEKFSGDVPSCGKFDFDGEPFNPTDSAPSPNQQTYPYKGYVFVLQNSDGNIIQFQHSELFVKDGSTALKLRLGETFSAPSQRVIRRMRLINYPDSRRVAPAQSTRSFQSQRTPSNP